MILGLGVLVSSMVALIGMALTTDRSKLTKQQRCGTLLQFIAAFGLAAAALWSMQNLEGKNDPGWYQITLGVIFIVASVCGGLFFYLRSDK